MFGFLRNLGRVGALSPELRAHLATDGAFVLEEKIGVSRRFSGHVPGVASALSVARYTGAVALTPTQAIATLPTAGDPALRALDLRWGPDGTDSGAARARFAPDGLHIAIDLRRVDPAFNGELSLHYRRPIPESVLNQIPAQEISYPVTPAFVFALVGVRGGHRAASSDSS